MMRIPFDLTSIENDLDSTRVQQLERNEIVEKLDSISFSNIDVFILAIQHKQGCSMKNFASPLFLILEILFISSSFLQNFFIVFLTENIFSLFSLVKV